MSCIERVKTVSDFDFAEEQLLKTLESLLELAKDHQYDEMLKNFDWEVSVNGLGTKYPKNYNVYLAFPDFQNTLYENKPPASLHDLIEFLKDGGK